MLKLNVVYDLLNEFAPFNQALSFDNCGILINSNPKEINTVIVATDLTNDTVKQAHLHKAQLIITHHPIFFRGAKSIAYNDAAYQCVQAGISHICVHTNFDACIGGLNDHLCGLFDLTNTQRIAHVNEPEILISRIGFTKNTETATTLANKVRDALGTTTVRYNMVDREINKVLVNSGGGSDMVETAINLGCDAAITGEISHHLWLLARERNFLIIDAGHFETEHYTRVILSDLLYKNFPQLNIIKAMESCPYIYL